MAGYEMHEAASTGDYDTLEEFLKTSKYDINMRDPEWKNRAPLHWACQRGYVDCIRLLLEFNANGTARMDMGWTPAHCAAEIGKLTSLRALVAADVPIDKKDKYGDTPRRLAEIYGHKECMYFLETAEWEQAMKRQGFSTDDDTDLYDSDDDDDEEEEEEEEGDGEEEGVLGEFCLEEDRTSRKKR